MSKYINITLSLVVIAIIYYFLSQVKEAGKNQEKVICQQEQIVITNEVIKYKEVVRKRKAITKSASPSINLDWLQAHACTDCASR